MTVTVRPRDYQLPLLDGIRDAYRHGARSVLGVAPTGYGKTISFSYMTAAATEKGWTTNIAAHRAELLSQIGKALDRFEVRHGYVAPKRRLDPLALAQVCSIRALANKIRAGRPGARFLVLDEAHHAAHGTDYHSVAEAHQERVLGVTATPERMSGEPLSDSFETMVEGPTVAELIKTGALTPFRAYAPSIPDMAAMHKRGGDFIKPELVDLMDRPRITGDAISHYRALIPGKRAVAFCVSVEHAENVAELFRLDGVPAASVDGSMTDDQRKAILGMFERGEVLVLTSCDLISEGYDLPAIDAAILLRPSESLGLVVQQMGRAFRPVYAEGFDLNTEWGRVQAIAEGPKPFCTIIDHAGNIMRHGLPDEEREWTLDGKKKGGPKGEKTIAMSRCQKCYGAFRPAPCCPYCGHVREIDAREVEQIAGELEEVDRYSLKKHQEFVARKIEERECKTLDDWKRLGHKRGNKPGWAYMMWKVKKAK